MSSPFKEGYSDFLENDNKKDVCIFNEFTSNLDNPIKYCSSIPNLHTDSNDDTEIIFSFLKDEINTKSNRKSSIIFTNSEYISEKVGIYTIEERKKRLSRWRKKRLRNRENRKNRKIKYMVRKKFADSRPRIGGRFIRMKK